MTQKYLEILVNTWKKVEHRGFSVYVSRKPITFKEATKVIDDLFEKHPYLIDCFHNIQNTASNSKKSDITHVSMSSYRDKYSESAKEIETETPTKTTETDNTTENASQASNSDNEIDF